MKTRLIPPIFVLAILVLVAFLLPNLKFANAKQSTMNVSPTTVSPLSSTTPSQTTPIPQILLTGGSDGNFALKNNVLSSINGSLWNQVMPNTIWSARSDHSLNYFNNGLWLMGGKTQSSGFSGNNDIYASVDGASWRQIPRRRVMWGERYGHATEVFGNSIFVMGGSSLNQSVVTQTYLNDVWSSPDGATWTQLPNAPWTPRQGHASLVFNNKIWVLGGEIGNSWPLRMYMNDVWAYDGTSWTTATASQRWIRRTQHSAVVHNGKMYVMGGLSNIGRTFIWFHDVWSSPDGINWTQETASAPWAGREGHVSLVFDGKIWVIGGTSYDRQTNQTRVYNDAWSSGDGRTWTLETSNIPNFLGGESAGVVLP